MKKYNLSNPLGVEFAGSQECASVTEPIFEKLLTVEQVADAVGFAPQTIRNWVSLRTIPYIRIGGETRFRREKLEAWIQQKEFTPCP